MVVVVVVVVDVVVGGGVTLRRCLKKKYHGKTLTYTAPRLLLYFYKIVFQIITTTHKRMFYF